VGELPAADLILMNPPFQSWNAMSSEQRSAVEQALGSRVARGDLSMAFISQALRVLNDGGTIGTVVPASVMTLSGAERWRASLLDQGSLRFIAALGEYGLFTHAMVNVGALVLQKAEQQENDRVLAVLSGNRAEATGDALRAARRSTTYQVSSSPDWQVFELPATEFRDRATWRLIPPRASAALERLTDSGLTRRAGEFFSVRQGVRTGNNRVFVLSLRDLRALPAKERKWFRPAAMGDNLNDGQLTETEFVFYPYGSKDLLIETEDELRAKVPVYFKTHLLPEKEKLAKRANIRESNRADWWGLSRPRSWGTSVAPRIVSKYFGSVGSFALDASARFVVVQGFAWFPKWDNIEPEAAEEAPIELGSFSSPDLLAAYLAVFNSAPFHRIVSLLSSHVAGGQFDLSPRFVNLVPIPDLIVASADETLGSRVSRLVALGNEPRPELREWSTAVDRIVTGLYGSELFEQIGYEGD
jgi:hypothetical protein